MALGRWSNLKPKSKPDPAQSRSVKGGGDDLELVLLDHVAGTAGAQLVRVDVVAGEEGGEFVQARDVAVRGGLEPADAVGAAAE